MERVIVVTGGAGYIGSHTTYLLAKAGYTVIILDTFLHNQPNLFPWAQCIKADFSDETILTTLFKMYKVEAVMHFAAYIEVGESVKNPALFYENNVVKTIKLLDIMRLHQVHRFIFSSSCAVYGNPLILPINESHSFNPMSPYGKSKLAIEYVLADYAVAYGLCYSSLRYFNAAGAFPEKMLGEYHEPETHVIPLLLRAIKTKIPFKVYGTDYRTPDGTCIRDYVHVRDIAYAHLKALEHLTKTQTSDVFNLGSGRGYSVQELLTMLEQMVDCVVPVEYTRRRAGDVDVLVADPSKAMSILGWQPYLSSLEFIVRSALRFDQIRNV